MGKRLFAAILAAAMVLCLLPAAALATENPPETTMPVNSGTLDKNYGTVTDDNGSAASGAVTLTVTGPADVPATGDRSMPWLWAGLLLIAAAGLSACTLSARRRISEP